MTSFNEEAVDISGLLTLVLPTHNRSAFLRRVLLFMTKMGERSRVRIIDSSDTPCRVANEQTCDLFSRYLSLDYRHVNLPVMEKFLDGVQRVETPYTVFCADDDFLVPQTLKQGLSFLESKQEYTCVGGVIMKVRTDTDSSHRLCRGYALDNPSAAVRSQQIAKHWYSTYYSLYRTPVLQNYLSHALASSDFDAARIFPELLLAQMCAMAGRTGFLPEIYHIRQVHDRNYGQQPIVQDVENLQQHYDNFRETLAVEFQKHIGLSPEQARSRVDRLYGHIRASSAKRSVLTRGQREVVRGLRKLQDRLRSDSYLEGRLLADDHRFQQAEAWQLARRLIINWPGGLSDNELRSEIGERAAA